MKSILFGIAIAVTFTACSNTSDQSKEIIKNRDTFPIVQASDTDVKRATADEIVTNYLQLKNALAADNAADAATAGKSLSELIQKVDITSLTTEQKHVFDEVKEDMQEHADHIGGNADKMAHQREHFDLLSKDMYDFVKVWKPSQALYWDHCPMYNDGKGANWLSEVKEIKNPYLGKKMPKCGSVQEELK